MQRRMDNFFYLICVDWWLQLRLWWDSCTWDGQLSLWSATPTDQQLKIHV